MKKIIAVLIALAMVLSMSVMAFAIFGEILSPADICDAPEEYNKAVTGEGWDPDADNDESDFYNRIIRDMENQGIYTDENGNLMVWDDAWTAYYAFVLAGASEDPKSAVLEIVGSVTSGYVAPGDAIAKIGETAMGGVGGDGEDGDMTGIIDQIVTGITGGDKEPEVSAEEYAAELAELLNNGAAFDEIASKIGDDLANGKIVTSQLPEIAQIISDSVDTGAIEDNETVQQILEFIDGIGGEGGFEFPDFGDITLPWDNNNSESGSFLDTILGIIGSIGDLFNPGSDDPDSPSTNNPSFGNDDPGEIPDTGDVSFVAVAAVAAVAGAALVLTRKKDDAE